jgi:tRNA1(Val) A37 N6-methylase TrmN6
VAEELSEDALLDGRVRLLQPRRGYRVALDPVLLAAAVRAEPGEQVLDAGAGTGAAGLCLAWRVPTCKVIGLELERGLQRIASQNVRLNQAEGRVDMLQGDVARPPPRLMAASFDHVMTNPPYLERGSASASPLPTRAAAHVELGLDLAGWLQASLRMLRPNGTLTLIHRADRLDAVLAALAGRLGDLVVFPFWPDARNRPAKRVIVQGRKGSRAPLRLARGLVLHEAGGHFTAVAQGILRRGEPLDPGKMDVDDG